MALKNKLNLAVLISGRGSNLQALIDACQGHDFPARVALVISNVPGVQGLERAHHAKIQTSTIDRKQFKTREEFEDALQEALAPHQIDLICLAGFMRVLSPHFLKHWPKKIINIHPSLLPDYKGVDTHARVLEDGRTETGCSVHYVVPEVDSGEIIVQRRVQILPGDTPETLAVRVLEQEHLAYPQAIRLLAQSLELRG